MAAVVVMLLILGASIGYSVSVSSGEGKAKSTSITTPSETQIPTETSSQTGNTTSAADQSPCSQEPLRESSFDQAFPNGSGVAETLYPVFALAPGSQGTFCVRYSNTSNSSLSRLSYSAFDWDNESFSSPGISITENPINASIPPHANATVVYMLRASNLSAGAYALNLRGSGCEGSYQLMVSDNASGPSFSDFPGLLGNLTSVPGMQCFYEPPPGTLVGFGGLSMVDLQYKTQFLVPFHETSRTIQSVVESPTEQNITIKLGVESYALPVTVEFLQRPGQDDFYMAHWSSNPQETNTPGDACDWENASSDYVNDYQQLAFPLQGVSIDAPTLHLQPYSNGTFTFSIRISNFTGGYAEGSGGLGSNNVYVTGGYYAALLSSYVEWDGGPSGYANLALATFFPVGQIGETVGGSCQVPAGFWTNIPWYLDGIPV